MARRLYPKKKVATLPFSDLVETGSPDLFYSVQQALQNEGVLLIDLYTGDIIEGQVNIPSVGMIAGNKPVKVKHQMGFVRSTLPNSIEIEKADIDAVLVLDAESQEPGRPLYVLIQVVDVDEMDLWNSLALTVARQFILKTRDGLQPEVVFGVTSLSRRNGQDSSARNASLRKIRNFSLLGTDSISDTEIPSDKDFYDDDDDLEC